MTIPFRFVTRIFVLLSLFCLAGCGGGSDDFIFTTGGEATAPGTVAGKLFLGTDIPDVPVTVESLNGQVLARDTTDGTGNFFIQGSFPSDFRLVARVEPNLVFRREVRGFPNQGFSAITVPTTLVSELASRQPGAALDAVETQARAILGLAPGEFIAKMDESVNERFSHLAFFARAVQVGSQVSSVEEIVNTNQAPFLLTADVLEADLSALGAPLADELREVQTRPRTVLSTHRSLSRGLSPSRVATAPSPSSARLVRGQFGEIAALLGTVALGVLEDVGADVITSVIDKIFDGGDDGGGVTKEQVLTWISYQLQAKIGIESDLTAISAELTGIQNEVQDVSQQLQDLVQQLNQQFQLAKLVDAIQDANSAQGKIVGLQTKLLEALDDAIAQGDYFDNQPSAIPQNIANVLDQIQDSAVQNELTTQINDLQALLTGSSNQPGITQSIEYPPIVVNVNSTGNADVPNPNITLSLRDSVYQSLGVSNGSGSEKMAHFPLRSSQLLDTVLGPLEAYGQTQILGAHLLAEAAHQSPTPTSDIKRAKAYADNVARSLQNTRAQLPDYPLNEDYLLDLQLGVQWCTTVQHPRDLFHALYFAGVYDDGDTTGWRLATYTEVQALLLRAGWAAGNGTRYDPENAILGLQRLGFNTDTLDGQSDLGCIGYGYGGNGLWGVDAAWGVDITADYSGSADSRRNQVTRLLSGSDSRRPYLMCRTLGNQPTLDIVNPDSSGLAVNPGSWPFIFAGSPINEELPSVGTFIDYGPAAISDLLVTLQGFYQIFTGDADGFLIGQTQFSTNYERSTDRAQSDTVPLTYFQTNDSAGVAVSNYSSTFGQIIKRMNSDQVTNIKFFTLGYDPDTDKYPVELSGTVPFNTTSPTQITMSQLQISPRNVVVDIPGTSGTTTNTKQFLAIGFSNGEKFDDFTDDVVWTVTDTDTGGTPVGAVFSTQQAGLLELTNVPNASQNLTVTATINQSGNPQAIGSDTTAVEAVH